VNEEHTSKQIEENYVLWEDDYVNKSQGEENPTNYSNENEEFSKVEFFEFEVTCHRFYRFIFDLRGTQAKNLRLNSFEKGENVVILIFSPLIRRIKSRKNQIIIGSKCYSHRSLYIYLVLVMSRALQFQLMCYLKR